VFRDREENLGLEGPRWFLLMRIMLEEVRIRGPYASPARVPRTRSMSVKLDRGSSLYAHHYYLSSPVCTHFPITSILTFLR